MRDETEIRKFWRALRTSIEADCQCEALGQADRCRAEKRRKQTAAEALEWALGENPYVQSFAENLIARQAARAAQPITEAGAPIYYNPEIGAYTTTPYPPLNNGIQVFTLLLNLLIPAAAAEQDAALLARLDAAGDAFKAQPLVIDSSNLADLVEHVESLSQLFRRARASAHQKGATP